MAFTYGNTAMWSFTGTLPYAWFKAAAAVTEGQILIVDNSGSGAGQVKHAAAVSTGFVSTAMEGGLVGVACNDAASGAMVKVALFTSWTGLALPAKASTTLDPGEAALGVAPTTYYGLYRTSAALGGGWEVDLDTTTNGVARYVAPDPADNVSYGVTVTSGVGVQGSFGTANTGGDATLIHVMFPASVRFYSA